MDLKASQSCPGKGMTEGGCVADAVPGLRHFKWVVLRVMGHRIICPGVTLMVPPQERA